MTQVVSADGATPSVADAPFGALAEHLPQLVWTARADGSWEYVNARWEQLVGGARDAALGLGWRAFVHPDDLARWPAPGVAPPSAPQPIRLRGAAGVVSLDVRIENAGKDHWVGIGVVVDGGREARRLEAEAVRRREERDRLVARATNDAVWDWDIASGRLVWNDSALQRFGCTPEQMGDRIEGWEERLHPDDRARVLAKVHTAIDGDAESWSDEYRFRKQDGSYAVFLDRGYIARDVSGRAYRMIGSMLDITELRRTEAALRDSERRFRTLADNVSQLVWITDAQGNLRWANERWLEYVGSRGELDGWSFERLLHPDHVVRVVEKFRRHLETGIAWEDTFPARRHDGVYRWFLSRANPIRNDAGEIVEWFGTNTDVTAQHQAEDALRDADRRKDEFLAMLAHELRNPLAPVRNAVDMLRIVGPREPTLDRLRDVIDRQVTHMARLIDDLLDVSRVARGRIQLHRERHDVVQLVRHTVDDYRESVEAAGLTLALGVERSPLWVDGDGTRLAQIVGNLLHNAGKFTERGGSVTVRVGFEPGGGEHPRGFAMISVRDTGIGMDPSMLARLFDPFAQATQGLDRSKGGLGLGLPLAKALAELHGGTISASSEGVGRGSTLVVRLPLAEPVIAGAPLEPESASPARGLRVLVVEDNQDAAETLQMLLEHAGHEVEVAFDGPTGIEAARTKRPDVLICDIGLPGNVDGYAVARALRAERETLPALMIALSGYGQEEDRRRSREAGFDAHISKPADFETLRSLLSRVERRPGA